MSSQSKSSLRRAAKTLVVVAAVQTFVNALSRLAARKVALGDETSDVLRRMAVLNGIDMAVTSPAFRHARFDLGLGGANIDLTAAALSPDGADIEVRGLLGGLNLKVPSTWRVTANSDSRLNGLNIPEAPELPEEAPHLHVVAHSRMSGVNVERV